MTLKEVVEYLKLYKELIVMAIAAVGAIVYVVNYYATKEALDQVRKALDKSIAQHNCDLANQILIANTSARLNWLEKDKIDKIREKTNLETTSIPSAPPAIVPYLQTQLDILKSDIARVESDIKLEIHKRDTAQDIINNRRCNPA
jgi:hypothetical protein